METKLSPVRDGRRPGRLVALLPSLPGLAGLEPPTPPMNRRAILFRPAGLGSVGKAARATSEDARPHPEGMLEISRGLNAVIPPESRLEEKPTLRVGSRLHRIYV